MSYYEWKFCDKVEIEMEADELESNTTDLVVVNTCLVRREAGYCCGFLFFIKEPSIDRRVRECNEDGAAGQNGNGSVD
jgi:hypothetical protein